VWGSSMAGPSKAGKVSRMAPGASPQRLNAVACDIAGRHREAREVVEVEVICHGVEQRGDAEGDEAQPNGIGKMTQRSRFWKRPSPIRDDRSGPPAGRKQVEEHDEAEEPKLPGGRKV